MKILELTNYSAGIDGVFARVKQESILLAQKGHEVRIFSSNFEKGTDKIVPANDKINGVYIERFPAKKLGGESFLSWNFKSEALKFKPDVIIAHSYRHQHTKKALKIAKEIGAKVFLVTHAPFERGETRTLPQKLIVWLYDKIVGRSTLNKFDKIIAITMWEIPYLLSLGVKKENIVYIPNGINSIFLRQKKALEKNKILFLGRIAPIKSLETLLEAIPLIKDKSLKVEIVGPAEADYLNKLKNLIKEKNLGKRVIFSPAIYDIKQKIKKIDSAKIFVLPSKSEGMPQSLVEAMAREKIVIAANNPASHDLIKDGKNGYLFEIGNEKSLASKINLSLAGNQKRIRKKARKSIEKFSWDKIIEKLSALISS